jgi:hypothetical protein
MAGGLIQLLSNRGVENIFLTFDANTSLFHTVYIRHSNFATETHEVPFRSGYGFGKKANCDLPKNLGDLITGVTINIELPSLLDEQLRHALSSCSSVHNEASCDPKSSSHRNCRCACNNCIRKKYADKPIYSYCNSIGHVLIESYELIIGGKTIDKQYGEWLEVWTELTQPLEKRLTYNEMVGRYDSQVFSVDKLCDKIDLYIPLGFWFCRNIGLSLPIVSLYHQGVSISVKFRNFSECWVGNVPLKEPIAPEFKAHMLVDYVYLDLDERHDFYDKPRSYLIEQIQCSKQTFNYQKGIIQKELPFKFAMKELIWFIQRDEAILAPNVLPEPISREGYPLGNDHYNFSLELNRRRKYVYETFEELSISSNGEEIFKPRKAKWFRLCQAYDHHTRASSNFIYMHCWAQRPESHAPTGVFNFSMADKVRMMVRLGNIQQPSTPVTNCTLTTYGVNYNVFVVKDGMCSLIFS